MKNIKNYKISQIRREFNKISLCIYNILEENKKKYIKRIRKTNLLDGFAYRILYSDIHQTNDTVSAKINFFNESNITKKAFSDREKQIDEDLYKTVLDKLSSLFHYKTTNDIAGKEIFAVDGTNNHFRLNLSEYGYPTKTDKFVFPKTLVVYNVTNSCSADLILKKHLSERKAFLEYIKSINNFGGIYVFDRGYSGKKFIEDLSLCGINYVVRMKEKESFVVQNLKNNNDVTFRLTNRGQQSVRIVKYIIDGHTYVLATNLTDKIDFPIEVFKDIYHLRWDVETYIGFIKKNTKFDNCYEISEKNIHKMYYSILIISKILSIIENLFNRFLRKSDQFKINRTLLTKGIFNELLLRLIYNKNITDGFIKNFLNFVSYNKFIPNKNHERTCKNPNRKWYTKQHLSKQHKKEHEKRAQQLNEQNKVNIVNNNQSA
jgi:hypothetical protein